jgi:hypothetical protein
VASVGRGAVRRRGSDCVWSGMGERGPLACRLRRLAGDSAPGSAREPPGLNPRPAIRSHPWTTTPTLELHLESGVRNVCRATLKGLSHAFQGAYDGGRKSWGIVALLLNPRLQSGTPSAFPRCVRWSGGSRTAGPRPPPPSALGHRPSAIGRYPGATNRSDLRGAGNGPPRGLRAVWACPRGPSGVCYA